MPLGAFKLNTISAALAAGGSAYSTLVASSTNQYHFRETSTGKYYKIYRFTSTGNLTVTTGGTADVLLVGGGAGRGGYAGGAGATGMGGGGGGGVLLSTGVTISSGTQSVTVGTAGAAGGTVFPDITAGVNGGDTTAFGLTAYGGGGGGAYYGSLNSVCYGKAAPGSGSGRGGGGGGGTYYSAGSTVAGGAGKYNGGNGYTETTNTWTLGGGGGGAGGNGGNAAGTTAGAGGAGVAQTFHVNSTNYYGCGGAGYRALSGGTNGSNPTGYPYFGSGGGATSSAQDGCAFIRNEVDPTKLDFSFLTSTTSTTSTITVPSGGILVNGDIGILVDISASANSTLPTEVLPSGWTSMQTASYTNAAGSRRIVISYKKLSTSDGGTTVTGMLSGGSYTNKILMIYRPSNPTTHGFFKYYGTSWNDVNFSTSTVPSQTLTLSSAYGPYVAMACTSSENTTTGHTITGQAGNRLISAGSGRTKLTTFEATTTTTSLINATVSSTDTGVNSMFTIIFRWYDQ